MKPIGMHKDKRKRSGDSGAVGVWLLRSILLLTAVGFVIGIGVKIAWLAQQTWNMTTSSDYTYDSTKVEFVGGVAQLKTLDQADTDNDATYGFGAGTHSNTEYSSGVQLSTTASAISATSDTKALWSLNQSSGSTVTDSSGNSNNGTLTGATWSTGGGKFSGGLVFNGTTGQFVTAADSASLDIPNTITLEAYVKPLGTHTAETYTVTYGVKSGGTGVWTAATGATWTTAGSGNSGRKIFWTSPSGTGNGTIHVVYARPADTQDPVYTAKYIYYAYSTDAGRTWNEEQVNPLACGNNDQEDPALAVDTSGNAHVVWQGKGWGANPTIWNIVYRKRDASTKLWGLANDTWTTYVQPITDVATNQLAPSIALDSSNNIYVAWVGPGGGDGVTTGQINIAYQNLQYRKYSGGAWATQQKVTDSTSAQNSPSIVVTPAAVPHIVWQSLGQFGTINSYPTINNIKHITPSAGVWLPTHPTNGIKNVTNIDTYHQYAPSAAIDGSNNIHAVWYGPYDVSNTKNNIRYSKYTTSWAAAENRTTGDSYHQYSPSISVDGSNLAVVWHGTDVTDATANNINYIRYNGTSWGTATKFTSGNTSNQYNPHAATLTANNYGILYAGSPDNSQYSVFYATTAGSRPNILEKGVTQWTVGPFAYGLELSGNTAYGYVNGHGVSWSPVISSAWNHLALTYDGSAERLYVNGDLKTSKPLVGKIRTNNDALVVGKGFNGALDEVAVWTTALVSDTTVNNNNIDDHGGTYRVSGNFISRVLDPGVSTSWSYITWTTADGTFAYKTAPANNQAGLVGAWHFDGDWTGDPGVTGTASGSATWSTADYKAGTYSASFASTSDYVTIADSASISFTTKMSLEAWAKSASTTATVQINKSGSYGLFVYDKKAQAQINGERYLEVRPQSGWNHYVLTYDNSLASENLKLYLNANKVATSDVKWTLTDTANGLVIGKANGLVDEVRVYGEALDEATIASNYKRGAINLIMDYDLDGGGWQGNSGGTSGATNYSFSVAGQQFRYRANLSTDNPTLTPKLTYAAINPAHYSDEDPTVVNNTAQAYATLTAWTAVSAGTGTIKYQISDDAGANWYYYSGGWQSASGYAQSNTNTDIVNNIASFGSGTGVHYPGTFKFKAFLHSANALQTAQLDSIDLGYNATGGIRLTAPNGGEHWTVDTTRTITWTATSDIANVRIKLSTTSGSAGSYSKVLFNSITNNGSKAWSVTDDISPNCRIRVSDAANPTTDATIYDASDNDFSIHGDLTLTSPNTAVEWTQGWVPVLPASPNINWNYTGGIVNVNLDYSTDGGTNWTAVTLGTNAINEGEFRWTIPLEPSSSCRVRVQDASDSATLDTSDVNFIIKGLRLTVPNGGETWTVGTSFNATWTSHGTIPNVKFEYSTNTGSGWTVITNSTANSSPYPWTVTGDAIGAQTRLRISDAANPTLINDASDANFTVPGVKLTVPNGGDTWTVGTAYNITWTTYGINHSIKLDYSLDSGANYSNAILASTPNDGSQSWTVPGEAIGTALRIQAASVTTSTIKDGSNADFTIQGLKLTAPNGSETWTVGDVNAVTWSTQGTITPVKLEYSTNSGSSYTTLTGASSVTNSGANGSFSWTVPIEAAGTATRLRVSSVNSPTIADASNADFIVKGIRVLVPNGTETWTINSVKAVSWTWGGQIDNVKLEYTQGGSTWTTIDASVSNTGSFNWTVVDKVGVQAKIKVSDAPGGTISDTSDANWTIKAVLSLTAPGEGEVLAPNSQYEITWTTTGTIANVQLDYSLNSGGNYSYSITGSTGNDGSFWWTVPDAASTGVRVRVADPNGLAIESASAGDFTISGLRVTSPDGGEVWTIGTAQNVNWSWNGFWTTAFKINYAIDGTNYNYTISANTGSIGCSQSPCSGTKSWAIPNDNTFIGGQTKVKVTRLGGSAETDTSNANFTIAAPKFTNVTITPPAADSVAYVGDTAAIAWTWVGSLLGNIEVAYSKDSPNYTNWTVCTGASGLLNDGTITSFNWTIPSDAVSTNLTKIRVTDTDSGRRTPSAGQNAAFTVKAQPAITINSPTASPTWTVGKGYTIDWAGSAGINNAVKVEVSTGDLSWTTVGSGLNATASLNWTVLQAALAAANSTSAGQVRISDTTRGASVTLIDVSSTANFTAARPGIRVTVPASGAYWTYGGTNQGIGWSTDGGVSTVDIYYDQDQTGAVSWSLIGDNVANTSNGSTTYTWTIPDDIGSTGILVEDTSRPATTEGQSSAFDIVGTLSLTSPSNLVANDTETISWTPTGTFSSVRLQFSSNGSTWYDMTNTTSGGSTTVSGANSYAWSVPNVTTSNALVKVYDPNYSTRTVATSSAFEIGAEPTITVTAPAQGVAQTWTVGTAHTISWTASANANNTMEIAWSTASVSWSVIASAKNKNDSVTWTLPQAALAAGSSSGTVQLRVRDLTRALTAMTWTPSITVVPPAITVGNVGDANNYLVVSETPALTWTSSGGEGGTTFTVAIQYNSVSGGAFTNVTGGGTVSSNANSTTSFTWTVPNDVGASQIKIYDTYRSSTASATSNNFTICGKFDSVAVASSSIAVGNSVVINWTTTGRVDSSNITILYYNSADFNTAQAIAAGDISNMTIGAGSGSCTWNIPTSIANSYLNTDLKIRIRDTRVPTNAVSYEDTSTTFQLKGSFTAPNPPASGTNWTIDTTKAITWTTSGIIPYVKLYYTTNANAGSPTWTIMDASANWSIANNANAATTWTWTIVDAVTANAKVRVDDAGNSNTTWSSAAFNIVGTVDLISPDGGETGWIIGTSRNVTWSTTAGTSSIANVKLQYSNDGGTNWKSMVGVAGQTTTEPSSGASGTYAWTIPDDYTTSARVRIYETNSLSNIDTSASNFVIAVPTYTFLVPGTTNTWVGANGITIGEANTISWTTVGSTDNNVKIEYSTDGFVSGTKNWVISASTANTGSYTYTFANSSSGAVAKIRITELPSGGRTEAGVKLSNGFNIYDTAQMTVTSPTSASNWVTGKNYVITWTQQGFINDNITISFSGVPSGSATWYTIATGVANTDNANLGGGTTGSYSWSVGKTAAYPNVWDLYSNPPTLTSNSATVKIKVRDETKAIEAQSATFTIKIPTITVSRPVGGEIWAIGDSAPILWTYDGSVIGPLALQYTTDGVEWIDFPATVTKTGQTAGNYNYSWAIPSGTSSSVAKIRIKDSQRTNSTADSAATFTIISAPTITVSSPASGSVYVVEEGMPISWSVRGLSVGNVSIKYWNDTDSSGTVNGSETLTDIDLSESKGASDTADANSGKYTGSYTWTVPASATAASTLRVQVSDGTYTGVSPQFRIRGGFEFRDETDTTAAFATTTNWKVGTSHAIKWYNKGTFPTVKLEYQAATSEAGLSSATWTVVPSPSGASTITNSPDANNISSYSWTVADPNANLYPTEPPASYYMKFRLTSTADTTITQTSNAFQVSYYTVTWKVKDDETQSLLSSLSVRSTSGSTIYWNVTNGDLTTDDDVRYIGTTWPRRYPRGTFTTIWSKTGYFDTTDSDRTITGDTTIDVLLSTTTPREIKVLGTFAYNEDDDSLQAKLWLEKKSVLVTGSSTDALGTAAINIYDGTTLKGSITGITNTSGYFNKTVSTVAATYSLTAGRSYFADCTIQYGGAAGTGNTYKASFTFSIPTAQKTKEIVAAVQATTATIQSLSSTIKSQTTAIKEAVRGEGEAVTETLTARVGKVLTAAETTIPTKLEAERKKIITEISEEVEPHIESGILNRESTVKQGETVKIRYRTKTGLKPVVSVYDPGNTQRVNSATMKEVGTTGIYEYDLEFASAWDKGDYTIITSESTKGTMDALIMTSTGTTLEEVGGQVAAVLGTTAGISDLTTTASTLISELAAIENAINALGTQAGQAAKEMTAASLEPIIASLKKVSADMQKLGGLEGYNLGDLLQISEKQADDVKYLSNKTMELKKMIEIIKALLERTVEEPVIQTWYESGSVVLRVLVVNPSTTISRTVPFKYYLPKEVKSHHIMDKGDLELAYDTKEGSYYVYKNIELKPAESRRLYVEIEDIWQIDLKEMESLKEQTKRLFETLKDSSYNERSKYLMEKIVKDLGDISARQEEAGVVNPEEHISVYRDNIKVMDLVKENILEMERLASRVPKVSPAATWRLIIIIVIFLALLSILFFFVWQSKLKETGPSPFDEDFEEKKPGKNVELESRETKEEKKVDIDDIRKRLGGGEPPA